jgi:hypothetical protein
MPLRERCSRPMQVYITASTDEIKATTVCGRPAGHSDTGCISIEAYQRKLDRVKEQVRLRAYQRWNQ